ncbi:hypothetical protein GCM10027579_24590 [Calidifontibacter terrae]
MALMLHGGQVEGLEATSNVDVAAAAVRLWTGRLRALAPDIAFVRVLNSVSGWNDPIKSPVADAEWALMRVKQLYPGLPIALVGHSMGGRVAFELVDRPDVQALVGLAPWLSDGYIEQRFLDTPTLLVHGRQDTVTSPDASRDLVNRIVDAGGEAHFESVPGWHSLLVRSGQWQRDVAAFLQRRLLG